MIAAEVKYKKTEIDWIPALPEHWGFIRLSFLCSITTGKKNTENKEEEGIYPFFVRSQTIERINSYSY
jgi:type I restriction enzyme S subunit